MQRDRFGNLEHALVAVGVVVQRQLLPVGRVKYLRVSECVKCPLGQKRVLCRELAVSPGSGCSFNFTYML